MQDPEETGSNLLLFLKNEKTQPSTQADRSNVSLVDLTPMASDCPYTAGAEIVVGKAKFPPLSG